MLSTTIPLSGMQAASLRLTAAASNIANANSNGALPDANGTVPAGAQTAYQPVRVEQSSMPVSNGVGGTTIGTVRNISPSYVAAYEPGASYANEQGMVATPNVDMANEMLNLVMAKADFSLNAVSAETINDMVKRLYDLGDR
jgi:flagellar basal-body rod protein FlgC